MENKSEKEDSNKFQRIDIIQSHVSFSDFSQYIQKYVTESFKIPPCFKIVTQ